MRPHAVHDPLVADTIIATVAIADSADDPSKAQPRSAVGYRTAPQRVVGMR